MGALAVNVRNALLNACARGVAYSNAQIWVQIHVGDPGTAGTANPAANAVRKQAMFGVDADAGVIANTLVLQWTSVPNTETYTHVSAWTQSSGGTLVATDDLSTVSAVNTGDDFTVPIGDFTLFITPP